MIDKLKVVGLNNSKSDIEINFKNDLNVLVGTNGCGKTTLLKLIWYVYSGNILSLYKDIKFTRIEMIADSINIIVINNIDKRIRPTVNYYDLEGNKIELESLSKDKEELYDPYIYHDKYLKIAQSLFFPTFRRIEGGYSSNDRITRRLSFDNRISDDLDRLSEDLSKPRHTFIVGVSTKDINRLISDKVTEITQQIDKSYQILSKSIESIISGIDLENIDVDQAKLALKGIYEETKKTKAKRVAISKPYNELQKLVSEFFKHKGIKITEDIFLGESTELLSENLSAGEKQMLSFLAFNAFYDNTVFLIDEPELSLHGDWQRSLFPKLLRQKKNNQFIIATHSPFIYANYPDKEIIVSIDKGN